MANGIPLRPGLQPFLRPRAAISGVSSGRDRGGKTGSYPIVRTAPYFAGTAGLLPGDPRQPQRGLFDIMSQQGYAAPPRPQVPAGYAGFAPPPRLQPTAPAIPAPPAPPAAQPGFLERIAGIDPTSAAGQALGAAAATGLQLSGYRPTPITTAEGLGAMMAAGQTAFREAKQAEREKMLSDIELAKAQMPQIKVAGDKIFRQYPDGRIEMLGGDVTKPIEVKSEAGRARLEDGRLTQLVIDKNGNLYEVGKVKAGSEIDPSQITFIDQYSSMSMKDVQKFKNDSITGPEKMLKLVDDLATQIEASPQGWADRAKASFISKIKRVTKDEFTDEEIALALSRGTLTQLVGSARLELFGPGVMTDFEQALAKEIFVGDFDKLTSQEAIARLNQFRKGPLDSYTQNIDFYNRQPIVPPGLQVKAYTPTFNWASATTVGGSAPAPAQAQQQSKTSSGIGYTVR